MRARTALLGGILVVGCDTGPTAGADVHRMSASGRDMWGATTRAATVVDEDVELDEDGRLVFAAVRQREPPRETIYLPPAQEVVTLAAGARRVFVVPGNEPWLLEPARDRSSHTIPTPLVAWVNYRAAQRAEWLRLVMPSAGTTFVVPRDQHVVGATVILDDEAVEVDETFVSILGVRGVARERRGFGPFHFGT